MANEIVPTWEEWNEQLTEEQRQYSQYKILQTMDQRLARIQQHQDEQPVLCAAQKNICGKCFASLKDVRWLTWGIRGIYSLIILGLVVAKLTGG